MRYGTVFYDACEAYNIKPVQWLYLDMVRGLSIANEANNYYARASNSYYSKAIGVSVRTVQTYTSLMSDAGWLDVKDNGHRKTTQKFNQLYLKCREGEKIAPMQKLHEGGAEIAHLGVKKLHGRGEKIAPNNNSIITEDNNNDKQLPFFSAKFKTAWQEWVQHRKEKRKAITPTAQKKQLAYLETLGEDRAIVALNYSIQQGWEGIYEPKPEKQVKEIDWKAVNSSPLY